MLSRTGVLVSVGFEYEGLAWDVVSRAQILRLRGHHHSIASVQMLCLNFDHAPKAVTLDDAGNLRLWELKSDRTGAGNAVCLHEFSLPVQDPKGAPRCFVAPFSPEYSLNEFSDLLIGGSRLQRMIPCKRMHEFVPPSVTAPNSASSHFVCAIGDTLHLWDMRDGEKADSVLRFISQ